MARQLYMNSDDTVANPLADNERQRSVVILDFAAPRDETMERRVYMDSADTVANTLADTEKQRSVVILDSAERRDEIERLNSRRPPREKSWMVKFQEFLRKCRIEQRGIEPVPEDERSDTNGVITVGTMWLGADMVVSSFAIGAIATPVFGLGFVDAVLTIFFVNMLTAIPVAFWSTFGPVFGMRQMVLSRFYFGFHGVKIIVLFNITACIGWLCLNTIVGAQLLNAVNNDLPPFGGILILAFGTFLVSLFGYKIVHAYQFWSWIPSFIVFLIVLGEFVKSGMFQNLPTAKGRNEAASVLTFAVPVFAFAARWTTYAADYTCYQPDTTSRRLVFLSTYLGLLFPLLFTQMLGAAVATATRNSPQYTNAYGHDKVGGLLAKVLYSSGSNLFGGFCTVVLALSVVANNCPNVYSLALNMQLLSRWTAKVPRAVWTLLVTLLYVKLAILGYSRFERLLEAMMSVLAYGLSIYIAIATAEHVVFKRGLRGYDTQIYDQAWLLPPGLAAMASFVFGMVGAILGMTQLWFVGPIAKLVGGRKGGDVGLELAFAFAGLSYLGLRRWERKVFKR